MDKAKPYYHVVIQQDDNELLNCELLVTFQKPPFMNYFTTVSSERYRSIDDALTAAKRDIADFMGREWL